MSGAFLSLVTRLIMWVGHEGEGGYRVVAGRRLAIGEDEGQSSAVQASDETRNRHGRGQAGPGHAAGNAQQRLEAGGAQVVGERELCATW